MGILKKLTAGLSTKTAALYAYQLLALKNVRSISSVSLSQANALVEGHGFVWQLHENDPIYGAGWDAGGAEVKVGVWWDFENCHVPSGIDAHRVGINIVSGLRSSGFKGPVTISGYGDMLQLSRSVQESLSATGIRLHHVPSGGKLSESSDRALLMDLILWTIENPPPAHLFLISGDRDFSTALHKLRMRNYNVLLACPVGTSISPSLLGAASRVWYWNSLVRGEGLVATTSWNHDGPPGGSPKSNLLPHSSSPPFPCPPIPPPFSGFPSSSFSAFPAISGISSPLPPPPPPPPPAPPAPSPYFSSLGPPPPAPSLSQATSTATKSGEITTSGNTFSVKSGQSSPNPENSVAHKSNKAEASPEMISRLDSILKAHPQGLWMGDLQNLMLLKKIQFDSDFFGHKKLVPFLLTLPHIARIERHLMKDSKTWSYMFFSSTAPVSDYKSSNRAGYPVEVLKQLGDLLNQYPKGIWLGEFNTQLIARNIRFDSNFYGHLKVVPFLLSMPEMVKVERRLLGDKKTWTYYFMSNQVGSMKVVSAANFAATGKKNGSLETSSFENKSVSAPAKKQGVYKNAQKPEVAISSSKVPQSRKNSPAGKLGEKSKLGFRAEKHPEELRAENQKRETPAETEVHAARTLVGMENAKVEISDSVDALSPSAENNQLPAEVVEKKENLEYALLKIEDPIETFSSKVAAASQSIFGFFRRIYQQLWPGGKSEESTTLAIEQGHARESESIAPAGVLCESSINEEDSHEPAVSLSEGNALGARNGSIVDEKSPERLAEQKLSFAEGEKYLGDVEREERSTMENEPSKRHALAKHKTVSKKNKRSIRRGDGTLRSTIAKNALKVKSPRTGSPYAKAESGIYDTHKVQLEHDISLVAPRFEEETTSVSTANAKASDEYFKKNVMETANFSATDLQKNLQCVTSEALLSSGTVSHSEVLRDSLTESKHRQHLSLPLLQFERESATAGLSDAKRTMELNTEKGKTDERSYMKYEEGLLVLHEGKFSPLYDQNVHGHELPSPEGMCSILDHDPTGEKRLEAEERAAAPREESLGEIQEVIFGDGCAMDLETKSDLVANEQGLDKSLMDADSACALDLAGNFEAQPLDRNEIEKPHLQEPADENLASTEAESELRLEQPGMVHEDKSGVSMDATLKQESEYVTVPCEEDNRTAVCTIKEDTSPASIDATRVLKLFERFMEKPSTSVAISKPSAERFMETLSTSVGISMPSDEQTSKSRLGYLASREEVKKLGCSIGSSEVLSFFETLKALPPVERPASSEHGSFADAATEYQSLEKPATAMYSTTLHNLVDKTAGATPNVFVDNQQDEESTISKDDASANRTHTTLEVECSKEHAFATSTNELAASKEIDAATLDEVQQREEPGIPQPLEAHETEKPNVSESLREIPADTADETATPKPKRSFKKKRGTAAGGDQSLEERPIPIDVLNMFRPLKENPALAKINETNKRSKKRKAGPGMTALVEAAFAFNAMAEKGK